MRNKTLVVDGYLDVTLRGKIEVTGGQLAALFWEMDSNGQAEFFNTLGATPPAVKFAAQMQNAAHAADAGGRSAMLVIGEVTK